ncbi:MAG: hypothetical protein WBM44_22050 [Waterburya sp.]
MYLFLVNKDKKQIKFSLSDRENYDLDSWRQCIYKFRLPKAYPVQDYRALDESEDRGQIAIAVPIFLAYIDCKANN